MNNRLAGDRNRRTETLVSTSLVLVGLVYAWVMLTLLPLEKLVAIPSDDAFYYFKIARNIVVGVGCTFDGIAPTNGFHPLWMICLLPIFSVLSSSLEIPVRVILGGSGLLGSVTLVIIYRLVRRQVGGGSEWIALAVCVLPPVSSALNNGLETGLLLFAITVLLWMCYRHDLHVASAGLYRTLLFGVYLGLVTLCRLDSAFVFVAAVFLTLLLTFVGEITLRRCIVRLAVLGVGFGVAFGPYCVWNAVQFGHIMPISGAMKSSFPSLRDSFTLHGDMLFGGILLGFMWVLLFAGGYTAPDRFGRWRKALSSPLTLLTTACTFHFAHAFLFLTWGVYWWHFCVYGLTVAIGFAQVLGQWSSRWPRARPAVIGTVVFVTLVPAVLLKVHEFRSKKAQHAAWLQGARWARQNTAPGTVFAIKDAGLFGYFSNRPAVNLDGKANGYAYRRALYGDDVAGYLQETKVEYIAQVAARYVNGVCRIPIPRVNRKPVVLVMPETDEVFHSRPFPIHRDRIRTTGEARFIIWEYAKEGVVGR